MTEINELLKKIMKNYLLVTLLSFLIGNIFFLISNPNYIVTIGILFLFVSYFVLFAKEIKK